MFVMFLVFPLLMSWAIVLLLLGLFLGFPRLIVPHVQKLDDPSFSVDIQALWIANSVVLIVAAAIFGIPLIKAMFNHTNFVVTSECFSQKMVLEFTSRFRDSVNHPSVAEVRPTVLDRIFLRQLKGTTVSLKEAKVSLLTPNHFLLAVDSVEFTT